MSTYIRRGVYMAWSIHPGSTGYTAVISSWQKCGRGYTARVLRYRQFSRRIQAECWAFDQSFIL